MSQSTTNGLYLAVDMQRCATNINDITILEGFVKSICSSYKLDVLSGFASESQNIVSYVLDKGHFNLYVIKGNKLIMDLLILDNGNITMVKLQHIKQQALDYFAPQLYRAQLKPRGHVAGHLDMM